MAESEIFWSYTSFGSSYHYVVVGGDTEERLAELVKNYKACGWDVCEPDGVSIIEYKYEQTLRRKL